MGYHVLELRLWIYTNIEKDTKSITSHCQNFTAHIIILIALSKSYEVNQAKVMCQWLNFNDQQDKSVRLLSYSQKGRHVTIITNHFLSNRQLHSQLTAKPFPPHCYLASPCLKTEQDQKNKIKNRQGWVFFLPFMEALKVKNYGNSCEINQRDLLLCLIISPWQL